MSQTGRKVLVAGAGDTAAAVARLVGDSGGHGFALVWTHPEYPIDGARDEEPPAGTAVTWSAVASYRASANRLARELGIDRRHVTAARGLAVVAVSAVSSFHDLAIGTACAELCRRLGANVHTGGDEPAPLCDTPREALLEALS